MNHPIHFVSLGPGDPELITLKGLKTLQKADIIYCPATQGKHGIISRATDILKAIEVDESLIHPFILPMSKERTDALNAYNELFLDAQAEYLKGKQIVIVAEGDAGFYSSIQYVYDKFEEAGIPVDRIAGIPAFIAAGALAGIHIVKQEEQINVIPGTASFDELSAKIENGMIIVIMKLPGCQEAIHTCIRQYADKAVFHYFENVGTGKEYYTTDITTIHSKDFHFSLRLSNSLAKKAARRVTKPGTAHLLRYMQYMLKLIDMETKRIHKVSLNYDT